jgi:GLPGLI family protein
MKFFSFLIITSLFLSACDSIDFSDQPQGIIEYDVVYLSNKSSMPTNLLPKKVTLKFRAHKSITTIEGFMGMFSLSNLSDFRKQTNTTMLKVMDNRFYYPGEKSESPFFFDGLKNIKIVLKSQTKVIAGLNCNKAEVQYLNVKQKPFDIYYTNQIIIKNVNKSTPFSCIDGVLIQFNISISNIEMRLTASKYKPDAVPKELFNVPDNYRKVSQEKLTGVIKKLLE